MKNIRNGYVEKPSLQVFHYNLVEAVLIDLKIRFINGKKVEERNEEELNTIDAVKKGHNKQ
jgi:hypothetical protein